jgi:periplasmic protein TonB
MEAEGKFEAVAPFAPAMAARPQERAFWIALACAAVVHAALIVGFVRSPPQRQLGEKGGRADGVSVEMVDAADLRSKNTFAKNGVLPGSPAPNPPAQSAPPVPKEVARPPEEEAKQEAVPRPNDGQAPKLVSPDEAAKQGKTVKEQKPDNPAGQIETQGLEPGLAQAVKPHDADAPSPPKKAAKPVQPQQVPKASPPLQLSLPDTLILPGGPSAAFSRPAGITRSGENDEFGRGVIRALRKSMPDPGTMRGRVTVRFVLSNDGNLTEIHLVRSSGDPLLDQNVMFSVKQSSFPFPPRNAPLVDRTFLVTYIYETRGRS